MTDFLLVHGAFHGGWCWDGLAALLRADGHRVLAPTLIGLADRPAGDRTICLSDHVTELGALIEAEDLRDLVLVGHSLGGMAVTAVADRCRPRIATLVYLDAFVPKSGEAARDFIPRPMYEAALQAVHRLGGSRLLPPIFPPEKFIGHGRPDLEPLLARLTPQPFLTFLEPVFLTNPPVARRAFLYCSGVPFGLFDGFAAEARDAPDWAYFDLPTAHDAMLLCPGQVAEILAGLG